MNSINMFRGRFMSVLSPHLREQAYGKRAVCFSLQDGRVVADSADKDEPAGKTQKLVLRMSDGSVGVADAQNWDIGCNIGDIITQVYVSPLHKTKKHLAAIINRSQRERQRVRPLGALLRKARVSREFTWWVSFVVLVLGAIFTDFGLFAKDIAAALAPLQEAIAGPLQPAVDLVSRPLGAVLNTLPMPTWSGRASAMFGSLQDYRVFSFVSVLLLVLIVWSRTLRLLAVPVFIYCLFILKTRLFGFDSAQGVVLYWYGPLSGLLVLTGLVNRYRDRWRMSSRLSAICKSQMAQPLPHNMAKEATSDPSPEPPQTEAPEAIAAQNDTKDSPDTGPVLQAPARP